MLKNVRAALWSLSLVSALVFVGCGGSGSSSSPVKGATNSGSTSENTVVLGELGSIDVYYITGAGRAAGDYLTGLQRVYFEDAIGEVSTSTSGTPPLNLSSYTPPTSVPINVSFPAGTATRNFDTFSLDLTNIEVLKTPDPSQFYTFDSSIPAVLTGEAELRVFPGRRTGLSVYLDPSMFTLDDTAGFSAVFSPARFREVNIPADATDRKLKGFFSDYLSFDITQMTSAKPTLSNGQPAARVYFSGDGFGISELGPSGLYDGLTPFFTETGEPIRVPGRFTVPSTLLGRPLPGTYTLTSTDPTDPTGARKVISLQGVWYDYSSRIVNMTKNVLLALPSSHDGNTQDAVYITQTVKTNADNTQSYTITDMKFGYIQYDFDKGTHKIFLYPIDQLVPGGVGAPQITGTLTNLSDRSGATAVTAQAVRTATYSLSNQGKGNLVVYRK